MERVRSPYEGLSARSYWRNGVVEAHPLRPLDLYRPKFTLETTDRVATAGSCFAQHIARALRERGCNVLDAEPAPTELPPKLAGQYGYGMFSARYGNIYTTRQMLQLLLEAEGAFSPADPIWTKDGRYYDALRPNIEPGGHESAEECRALREAHLQAVRKLFNSATVVVFTLGLTEAWLHGASGTVYPTAPGTIAGSFDPAAHAFKNFTYEEILADLRRIRNRLKRKQPGLRMLLTVSPVPLTATASDQHVLVATTYSKSVLRAAAGAFASAHDDVDYFPSFEIISGIQARGFFYESNLRSVAPEGVKVVMECFFGAHSNLSPPAKGQPGQFLPPPVAAKGRPAAPVPGVPAGPRSAPTAHAAQESDADEVVCEEALLEAFARQ